MEKVWSKRVKANQDEPEDEGDYGCEIESETQSFIMAAITQKQYTGEYHANESNSSDDSAAKLTG
jgi:hypothetical protein